MDISPLVLAGTDQTHAGEVLSNLADTRVPPSRIQWDWGRIRRVLRRSQLHFGVVVIVPTLVWYYLFLFQPIFQAFRIAMVDYKILDPQNSPFIGVGNYHRLLLNPLFLTSIKNTFTWTLYIFLFMLPLSIAIATALSNVRRLRNFYQAVIFIPVVVSLVAVSLLFRMVMDPEIGQLNRLLDLVGLPPFQWLSSTATALVTISGIAVWKSIGFYVVLLTAGMLNIPEELIDAARVDGANEWQRFWRVTIPLLTHTIILILVLLTVGSLQEFTLPYVMTEGGPETATYLYNLLIYQEAFTHIRFGTATVAALFQFMFILVCSLVQIRILRPNWSY